MCLSSDFHWNHRDRQGGMCSLCLSFNAKAEKSLKSFLQHLLTFGVAAEESDDILIPDILYGSCFMWSRTSKNQFLVLNVNQ